MTWEGRREVLIKDKGPGGKRSLSAASRMVAFSLF